MGFFWKNLDKERLENIYSKQTELESRMSRLETQMLDLVTLLDSIKHKIIKRMQPKKEEEEEEESWAGIPKTKV